MVFVEDILYDQVQCIKFVFWIRSHPSDDSKSDSSLDIEFRYNLVKIIYIEV